MNTILHQPFDIETHKKHFINYLEVVILQDGTVEYAVPSHQEKLISVAMKRLGLTRKEIEDICPPEFHGDFIGWLSYVSKAIPVWNEFFLGHMNSKQVDTLVLLKEHGLYQGVVPQVVITREEMK